jgi:hypothetical protein
MHRIIVSALLLSTLVFGAQTEKRPDNWFNLDPANNNINGVSTERTYKELLTNKKSTTVIVGVIDSGVDYNHEDLKAVMWTNIGEIAGNGVDDDKNGYVDDIHGWNFIGGKDGKNVSEDNLEMTRLVRKLKSKYDGKKESDFKTKEEKNMNWCPNCGKILIWNNIMNGIVVYPNVLQCKPRTPVFTEKAHPESGYSSS